MFYIQDGRFSKSLTVHEAILTAATSLTDEVKIGAGVFAFVTSGGASLVFEDQALKDFFSNGSFTLIVGIDDITNTTALKKLRDLQDMYSPNLLIRVFFHNDLSSLFHPKFIWFKSDEEIRLITGSGNLTEKGLRRNREAFTINNYINEDLSDFEEYWESWIRENSENLRDLEDEEVIARAAKNSRRFFRTRRVEAELDVVEENDDIIPVAEEVDTRNIGEDIGEAVYENPVDNLATFDLEDFEAWTIEDNPEVLIAEIPNSGNRWKQANFSMVVFENFFGGIAGVNEERRILLRHVSSAGRLEGLEVRPTVSVRSQNYRVELNAASGLAYPEGYNRPIGIFIKVSTRSFLYSLFMPGDVTYNEILDYLNASQVREGKLRRFLTNVDNLRLNCPSLSFWLI